MSKGNDYTEGCVNNLMINMIMNIKEWLNRFPFENYWWIYFLIIFMFSEIIKIVLRKILTFIYRIFLLNFHFIFNIQEEKTKDNQTSELNTKTEVPNFSIQNQIPNELYQDKNLTLIELKMLEINRKENENKHKEQSFRLELNQYKMETKIELQQQKNYFEQEMLKQQINNLEKELLKITTKPKFYHQDSSIKQESKNNTSKTNNKLSQNLLENIDLTFIDEALKKQIPESLKKIFDRMENFAEIQLFMLNNMPIENRNNFYNVSHSYYDSKNKALYIDPKDLIFVKSLLIEKQKQFKQIKQ
ncbi:MULTISPECIES: hypothetical protein [Candidatus Phytoplasma]|uniref:Transmembrane protein n=2 Tax=Candidatus Phytoplasma TaxID=33926 RepID=A0ABN0J863_PEWBP|nr:MULTISPECIES: hypothetical protein [Phytoplasma]QLL36973.1 hypothetical protein EPWB_v2c3840 ['Echinacea purpurea' witches'-broom phytoplasma]WEX20309.1 MAG: hypothetical protein TB2022_2160 [Candidatus Phytoplasma aurantifolia]WKV64220.1 MAG: hypothetical protein NCHU2022_c3850 [Candidatus Phytoplasma australasiaticum]EMR14674.1 hypothetical protein PNWB_v1c1330 [Peanut witches'-broom phytoplasma NTU2011]MDO8052523.1 hypothetical protein ['Vigna radiata' phytoplasma]